MPERLLIVGASVRAAAQSAARAGYEPYAIDAFADEDLRACCPAQRVAEYPAGIPSLAQLFPDAPVLYTGALENSPQTLASLAAARALLGNPAEIVQAVRDPWLLARGLANGGLLVPEARKPAVELDSPEWLLKPVRSGGGLGIRRLGDPRRPLTPQAVQMVQASHYCQQYIRGDSISALYLAAGGSAALWDVTRQLIGCRWAGAESFWYVGNIASVNLPPAATEQLQSFGNRLAREFDLQGLFGIDAILQQDQVYVVEVNPRYTAAAEVIERRTGTPAIKLHVEACTRRTLPALPTSAVGALHGKAALYARRTITIPDRFAPWTSLQNTNERFPAVADLPAVDTTILQGKPICTIFAHGDGEFAVLEALQQLAQEAYAVLES